MTGSMQDFPQDDIQLCPPEQTGIQWDFRLLLTAAIAFVTGYILLPGVGRLFCESASPEQMIFSVGGIFLALASLLYTVRYMAGSWRAAAVMLDLKKFSVRDILLAWPLALLIAITGSGLTILWTWLAGLAGIEFGLPPTTSIMFNGSAWQIAALIITATAAAPLFEEIVFRKALCGALSRSCGYFPAVVLTAIVFGAMHFSWQQLPGLIFFSIVWQLIYRRSGSLSTAVILHFFNNLFSVAMLLAVRCRGLDI